MGNKSGIFSDLPDIVSKSEEMISQAFANYESKIMNNQHLSKLPYFLTTYLNLGYDEKLEFIRSFVFFLNALIDSIDDSIDNVPLKFRKDIYFNQIVIFVSFIQVFEQVLSNQLNRIPERVRNNLNSVKFVEEMKNCVVKLVNIPNLEKRGSSKIESSSKIEELSDLIYEYLLNRTFHIKLCTRLLDILLSNSTEMDVIVHCHFAAKSLEKDSRIAEISKDIENSCSNPFVSLRKNPIVDTSNINSIVRKSLEKLYLNQKNAIVSISSFKHINQRLINVDVILRNIINNLEAQNLFMK